MKARVIAPVAAGLIVLGAVTDRVINDATSQPAAAAQPPSTIVNHSPSNTTVNAAPQSVSAAGIDAATEHAYAVASPSVVYVVSQGVGSGSGVIYDSNGDIVTNNHVV